MNANLNIYFSELKYACHDLHNMYSASVLMLEQHSAVRANISLLFFLSCHFNKAHANSLTPYILNYITPNKMSVIWPEMTPNNNITVEKLHYLK